MDGQFSDADENSLSAYLPHKICLTTVEENWDEPVKESDLHSNSDEENISEDSDDWDYDDDYGPDTLCDHFEPHEINDLTKKVQDYQHGRQKCNVNNPIRNAMQPKNKILQKYDAKIYLGKYNGMANCADSVTNQLYQYEKGEFDKITHKDKSDRATVNQVLDNIVRDILKKTMHSCKLKQINGCVSTGKEAHVYHAVDIYGMEYAIKIYKTNCMSFIHREQYMSGNHSCRHGYSKAKNARKMVDTWSSKEFRNLRLLEKSDINSPNVIKRDRNVVTMQFLGKDGKPAPKLKDIQITPDKAGEFYVEVAIIIRKLYRDCKLVHADLSEYNILYFDDKLYIIDVSQSVEPGQPSAFSYLKRDIFNITEFFRKKGALTMRLIELFLFVVSDAIKDVDAYLKKMETKAKHRINSVSLKEQEHEDKIFLEEFTPRCLNDVNTFETDFENLLAGKIQPKDLTYMEIVGIHFNNMTLQEKSTNVVPKTDNVTQEVTDNTSEEVPSTGDQNGLEGETPDIFTSSDSDDDLSDEDSSSENSDDDVELDENELAELKMRRRPPGRPKNETAEERKSRKSAVKENQSEKRKIKVPKKVKRKLVKNSKRNKRLPK